MSALILLCEGQGHDFYCDSAAVAIVPFSCVVTFFNLNDQDTHIYDATIIIINTRISTIDYYATSLGEGA